ncbi:MAG TPA: hypothetical protein VIL36_11265 [Acidimicrobiales bacterium]
MRRRHIAAGAVVVVAATLGAAWYTGLPPFALDASERALLDELHSGGPTADAATAAAFVDDHLEALLSADIADAAHDGALSELFGLALDGDAPGMGRQDRLARLERIADAVADQGELPSDELRVLLADTIAENVAWLDDIVSATVRPELTLEPAPEGTTDRLLDVHDLLREIVRNPEADERIEQAVDDYGLAETVAAADSGVSRQYRLPGLGALRLFVFLAWQNASRGPGFDSTDRDAVDAAEEREAARYFEAVADPAAWAATDAFESDTPAGAELRRSAQGEPFLTPDGHLDPDMDAEQAGAFVFWARTECHPGRPLYDDCALFALGRQSIGMSFLEDRY